MVNEAPDLTAWDVRDNTSFASPEELERAMPFNRPPQVEAGPDVRTDQRSVLLQGTASDDGKPEGKHLVARWEAVEGPGHVAFDDPEKAEARATFEAPGDYLLRLVADDGEFWRSDWVVVHILPSGTTIRAG